MPDVTIHQNPACGTSRNTLALIRNAGIVPEVIEYLETPPSRVRLREFIAATGIGRRELLRQKGAPYDEPGLGADTRTDAQLLAFMLAHPILINRPIAVTPGGTRLCHPPRWFWTSRRRPSAGRLPRKTAKSSSIRTANVSDNEPPSTNLDPDA